MTPKTPIHKLADFCLPPKGVRGTHSSLSLASLSLRSLRSWDSFVPTLTDLANLYRE